MCYPEWNQALVDLLRGQNTQVLQLSYIPAALHSRTTTIVYCNKTSSCLWAERQVKAALLSLRTVWPIFLQRCLITTNVAGQETVRTEIMKGCECACSKYHAMVWYVERAMHSACSEFPLLGTERYCLKFWSYCRTILVKHECQNMILISAWHLCVKSSVWGGCVRQVCWYYSPVEMIQMTGKSALTEQHLQCRMQKSFRTGTAHKPSPKPEAYCKFKSHFSYAAFMIFYSFILTKCYSRLFFKQYGPVYHPPCPLKDEKPLSLCV